MRIFRTGGSVVQWYVDSAPWLMSLDLVGESPDSSVHRQRFGEVRPG